MFPTYTHLNNPEDSPPEWTAFEEVSATCKDLWEVVNGFRVDFNDLLAESKELGSEVDDLKSALESSESGRDECKSEVEGLADKRSCGGEHL